MDDSASLLMPTFLRRLADPAIRTVLLCGCGGGHDFVASLLLVPELRRLGKKVLIGSYSFGDPEEIGGEAPVVFREGDAVAKRVTAASVPPAAYAPEVRVCSFLDRRFPKDGPHAVYAYYARAFSVPRLRRLYAGWVAEHAIDAVVLFDGGSDSLMVGDEEGLGDPVEDAVSVTAVATLDGPRVAILVSVGLGSDRFNGVSDAASLRAIAELTRSGGYLGALGLEPGGEAFEFYRAAVRHLYAGQEFRSGVTANVVSAVEGCFGAECAPDVLPLGHSPPRTLFVWPPMALLWAFDVRAVAERSLLAHWIRDCETPRECWLAVAAGRRALGPRRRGVENLPRHEEVDGTQGSGW